MMLPQPSIKKFINFCLLGLISSMVIILAFILIVDPYDSLPFSPRWQRSPMCSNQRFSYPMLAKRTEFDSAIFGTSTVRLFKPEILNVKLNANFVNLSMDSASFYEQNKLFEVFIKHHPSPKYVIFGIDKVWCDASSELKKFAGRAFPEWLYDNNPWTHPFYMFNKNTFEQAIRQLGYLLKKKEARFGLDGYANFLPNESEYDLDKARKNLYASKKINNEIVPENFAATVNIQQLAYMKEMISKLPKTTEILFVFVPYHHNHQPNANTCEGVVLKECKSKFKELVRANPNIKLFDFMVASDITLKDENYWDPLHYNLAVADRLMNEITKTKSKYQIENVAEDSNAIPSNDKLLQRAEEIIQDINSNKSISKYSHDNIIEVTSQGKNNYNVDCSGFLNKIIIAKHQKALEEIQAFIDATSELPKPKRFDPWPLHYVQFINSAKPKKHWETIENALDLKPGDIIAYTSPQHDLSSERGQHIMMVAKEISLSAEDSWILVPIYDSTQRLHGPNDKRTQQGGIGFATIALELDQDKRPKRIKWYPESKFVLERQLKMMRLKD